MVEACGYKVAEMKRLQVGGFQLQDMEEGQLRAATAAEEAWACELAGLASSEYPEGLLPQRRPRK